MRWTAPFVAAILLAVVTVPSAAQIKLDMNQITCGDWLGYSPEDKNFIRFWISGYYNAAANNNVLDYTRLQKNTEKVTAYCKSHKSDPLPKAINKVAS